MMVLSRIQYRPEWTDNRVTATVQNMSINLGSTDILVANLFLDGANIHAAFQQVGGEGMA